MGKREDIEFVRILSIFGIVWYHSGVAGHEIAYGGLVVFLILSTYLAGQSTHPEHTTLRSRSLRFLLPWALWFFLYAAWNLALGRAALPGRGNVVASILAGPSIHLWYMPFMFFFLVVFDKLRNVLHDWRPRDAFAACAALLAVAWILLTPVWRAPSEKAGAPLAQYAHALAGALIGVFFAGMAQMKRAFSIVLLMAIALAEVVAIQYEGVGIPYLVGTAIGLVLAVGLFAKFRFLPFHVLGQCTLGIYFLHPILLAIANHFHPVNETLVPILAFVISAALVMVGRAVAPRLSQFWS